MFTSCVRSSWRCSLASPTPSLTRSRGQIWGCWNSRKKQKSEGKNIVLLIFSCHSVSDAVILISSSHPSSLLFYFFTFSPILPLYLPSSPLLFPSILLSFPLPSSLVIDCRCVHGRDSGSRTSSFGDGGVDVGHFRQNSGWSRAEHLSAFDSLRVQHHFGSLPISKSTNRRRHRFVRRWVT